MAANGSNVTQVAASASAVALIATNVQRHADASGPSLVVTNNGSTALSILLGDGQATLGGEVTTGKYSYQLAVGAAQEIWGYRGPIRGIWAGSPTGNATVTELL